MIYILKVILSLLIITIGILIIKYVNEKENDLYDLWYNNPKLILSACAIIVIAIITIIEVMIKFFG